MPQGDPNLDPAWDWTGENRYALYSSVNGGPVQQSNCQLPFFLSGSPLNNFQTPDMYPEDGWVLVHRDFGTPEAAQPFPFFTLYNRYRGIFRVMLFNAVNREGTYFLGELSFLEGARYPEARAGLFSFADSNGFRACLDNYDPSITLTALSAMTAYGSWAVFDFPLVGYDPDLKKKDPILVFKLTSIEKQDFNLQSAGSLQLFQAVENGEQARPGFASTAGALFEAGRKGFASYKTVDAFMKNEILSKAGEEKNKNEAWFGVAKRIATSSAGCYAPIVAGLGAAIESFVGGAHAASEWEHLNFKGQLQFDTQGVLKTTRVLWYHNFFLNAGSREDGRAQRPVQDLDWGVFNFNRMARGQESHQPYRRNNWVGADVTWKLLEPPSIIVNPGAGLELVSVRVAHIRKEENGVDKAVSGFMTVQEAMEKGITYDRRKETQQGTGLIWELHFQTLSPTRFADRDILVVKKMGDW